MTLAVRVPPGRGGAVTALAAGGTHRAAVLAHLALVPDLTAGELAHVIGARYSLSELLAAMEHRAEVVCRTEWRPQQGRQVRLWRLAPPGTVPPPRAPEPADVAARRRERDRLTQRARRARRRRPAPPPLVAAALPGAACAAADPCLFFPEPGDVATEAAAKAICAGCPVRAACYAGAIGRGERWGVWGGTNLETVHSRPAPAGDCHTEGAPSEPGSSSLLTPRPAASFARAQQQAGAYSSPQQGPGGPHR
jgi:Transcription factor WhiB